MRTIDLAVVVHRLHGHVAVAIRKEQFPHGLENAQRKEHVGFAQQSQAGPDGFHQERL